MYIKFEYMPNIDDAILLIEDDDLIGIKTIASKYMDLMVV